MTDQDTEMLMGFYQLGRNEGGNFDTGIEMALDRILVDPEFFFRKEPEPANLEAGQEYRISDLELASRLSFFLWSSIPDDELINAGQPEQAARARCAGAASEAHAGRSAVGAAGHELRRPVAEPCAACRRMVPDPRIVPRFRRQSARRHAQGNGAVRRQHRSRRPQPDRSARRQLHVRQ